MAGRREKLRRVGIIPEYRGFTPDGLASGEAIDMTVDELEVLRLCDLEGLNQEAVAQHMGIARATVAAICSRAHRKVANALVNGRAIVIEGGNIAYSPVTTTTATSLCTLAAASSSRSTTFRTARYSTSRSWAPAAPVTAH